MIKESYSYLDNEPSHPENNEIRLNGRTLYLTQDLTNIRKQLDGEDIVVSNPSELLDNISTDEIIPAKVCLLYTGKEEGLLGDHFLTGLRGDAIKPGDVRKGNFQAVIAGNSYGRGSSRMHAQIAHREAGINVVAAETERIFRENCVNYGIFTGSVDDEAMQKLINERKTSVEELTESLSPLSQEVMKAGGLLNFLQKFKNRELAITTPETALRPMTMIEKIIAQRVDTGTGIGVPYVKPGQEYVVRPDKYYGYELQTPVTRAAIKEQFGDEFPVPHPEKLSLHNDHTALLPQSIEAAVTQRREQTSFALHLVPRGATIYEASTQEGVEGICHTVMLEKHAFPGELILGNDSHTCTLGAVNALAVGKGAIDLAGAITFDRMVTSVPETIRFNFSNEMPSGITSKDVILHILSLPELKKELVGSNRVFEYGGEGLSTIPFDDQIKFTNMAIEGQGFTGILEPNDRIVEYLMDQRGLSEEEVRQNLVFSDANAEYARVFDIDLSHIEPTVAEPGDAQNGRKLSEVVSEHIKIHKAYIGSCTHGTPTDLMQAAEVLKGRTLSPEVSLYVQASSRRNFSAAEEAGYIKVFEEAGAVILPPGCGACMNAGPGSTEEGEIGIFATNRNFPGRTGKGMAYLASPAVVAASAVKGEICGPESLEETV